MANDNDNDQQDFTVPNEKLQVLIQKFVGTFTLREIHIINYTDIQRKNVKVGELKY